MEPTFVIAGGQRCGTTSLYRLFDTHPDVRMARPVWPEPKYFVHDPRHGRDRDWYVTTFFADAGDAHAVGEKSTSYLENRAAARRMTQQFSNLRVVVILRHPVERAVSNYRFSVRNGLETESFAQAIRTESTRRRGTLAEGMSADPFAYVQRGHYLDHLRPYVDLFDRDHLSIALYDDLVQRPTELMAQLYSFVGVDAGYTPPASDRHHNAHTPDGLQIDRRLLSDLCEQFADSNRELARLIDRDLTDWSRLTPELEALSVDS